MSVITTRNADGSYDIEYRARGIGPKEALVSTTQTMLRMWYPERDPTIAEIFGGVHKVSDALFYFCDKDERVRCENCAMIELCKRYGH